VTASTAADSTWLGERPKYQAATLVRADELEHEAEPGVPGQQHPPEPARPQPGAQPPPQQQQLRQPERLVKGRRVQRHLPQVHGGSEARGVQGVGDGGPALRGQGSMAAAAQVTSHPGDGEQQGEGQHAVIEPDTPVQAAAQQHPPGQGPHGERAEQRAVEYLRARPADGYPPEEAGAVPEGGPAQHRGKQGPPGRGARAPDPPREPRGSQEEAGQIGELVLPQGPVASQDFEFVEEAHKRSLRPTPSSTVENRTPGWKIL